MARSHSRSWSCHANLNRVEAVAEAGQVARDWRRAEATRWGEAAAEPKLPSGARLPPSRNIGRRRSELFLPVIFTPSLSESRLGGSLAPPDSTFRLLVRHSKIVRLLKPVDF